MATLHVTSEDGDVRLDRFLRRHYANIPQSVVQKLCRKRSIRLAGKKTSPAVRVKPGDEITYPDSLTDFSTKKKEVLTPKEVTRLTEQFNEMVIYSDDELIAINKPPGLAVQGGTSIGRHIDQMLDAIAHRDTYRPHLVHRLDRDTSGVLLIARTPKMAAYLTRAFRERDIKKKYWALTNSVPRHQSGYIGSDQKNKICAQGPQNMMPTQNTGIYALSSYQLVKRSSSGLGWLALSPFTGRKHQLRIHCALLGTPILGDRKYGSKRDEQRQKNMPLFLHARHIHVPHPQKGYLQLTAPLPQQMRSTYIELGLLSA